MRIAHLADAHLGLQQYYRQNPAGANEREADAMRAFTYAIDDVLLSAVDLVLIPGDLFDKAKPPNHTIIQAYRQFRRLQDAGIPVVILGGNHDTPRQAELTPILELMAEFSNVHGVTRRAASVRVGDVNVACWPTGAEDHDVRLEPDVDARWNIFLAHIESDRLPHPWAYSNWNYVALGDYHVAHEVNPGVWYSGSLEYGSSNPWGELKEERQRDLPGKGWLLVELRENDFPLVSFQPVPTRRYLDLPPIDAAALLAEEFDCLLADRMANADIKGAVVRQVVENAPRAWQRTVDHERIRGYRAEALHLWLDYRIPKTQRVMGMPAARVIGRSLADIVADHLERRALRPEIDRERLIALGRKYVGEAESESFSISGR